MPLTDVQVFGVDRPLFHLRTSTTSMVLRVSRAGHLEQVWFGDGLQGDAAALSALWKPETEGFGLIVNHGRTADPHYSLAQTPLAWSTHGKGDFRSPALRLTDNQVLDFTYSSHRVVKGGLVSPGLPGGDAEADSSTLEITLDDEVAGVQVLLRWTTFPQSGVITRRAVVRNAGQGPITLEHAASMLVDLPDREFDLITFNGYWLSESLPQRTRLGATQVVNESTSGASNSKHQPGFLLVDPSATEEQGQCWGFNLVWSGSHHSSIESDVNGFVRVVSGINPAGFAWTLAPGEEFHTPEAVLAHSDAGLNGLAQSFHRFVNDSLVASYWRHRERPVVLNNWEGTYFKFDADKLVEMAAAAAPLGVETFVLDDGWFGTRSDDRQGLGDWTVNTDKLPGGLESLAQRINALGLGLGLWFEPEAVNPDSDLYRAHPDWAIAAPGRRPSEGRFEYLLDLTRPEVRDYLVEAVSAILDKVNITFVKWDMNRHISDAVEPGFHYRYILGLYDVLDRIFGPRPHVLLENCSSGGGRFDLGLLPWGPQTWASDCTDPVARLEIQRGLSYLYPPSTISAHVSASPNHQTGRTYSMDFRFDVSAPFVFGIELDPRAMSRRAAKTITERIAWYKQHRRLLQFGDLHWVTRPTHLPQLALVGQDEAISFSYETLVRPREARGRLVVPGLVMPELVRSEQGRSEQGSEPGHLAAESAQVTLTWPFSKHRDCTVPAAAIRGGLQRTGRALDLFSEVVEVRLIR